MTFDISIAEGSGCALPNKKFINDLQEIFIDILKEFDKEQRGCSIIICNDKFMHRLNKKYRGIDSSTDVLSFALDDDDEFPVFDFGSLGDIIISDDMVKTQAKEFDVSTEEEFARLAIHGLLHLLGFDHEKSQEEHDIMFKYQDHFMDLFMQKYSGQNSQQI
ncbi:MAG: rRNA maturation RNase YbeY [Brevinema sp.]